MQYSPDESECVRKWKLDISGPTQRRMSRGEVNVVVPSQTDRWVGSL